MKIALTLHFKLNFLHLYFPNLNGHILGLVYIQYMCNLVTFILFLLTRKRRMVIRLPFMYIDLDVR